MIYSKKELKECLKYEFNMYFYSESKIKVWILSTFNLGEKYCIWKLQKILRKYEYHLNKKHQIRKYYYGIIYFKLSRKYCVHIPANTIDKGLKIMHLGPILINANVRIGKDCVLHINTGIIARGNSNGTPCIGDNVIIGYGATLLGDIKINDGIVVGAGSVVNKSFYEKNITIAGVPAKKISDLGSESWKNI